MSDKPLIIQSARRVLRVMKALRGHALNGLSNNELASRLQESPANITRCIHTLEAEGLAIRLDNGHFAPGMALLQIAQATADELDSSGRRLAEVRQRIQAGAR